MISVSIISVLSILGTFLCLTLFPKVKIAGHSFSTFYFPSFLGLLILLITGLLPINDYFSSLIKDEAMNPLEILALFFPMAFISTILDEVGFFSYLANKMVKKAKGSQIALFFLLYGLCAILTMFTSNDIVIITFTPFILFFAKDAKINPIPYLVCEFVAANTWSMMFIFGNPTNVYLASYYSLDFVSYFLKMWLPTLFAGLASLSIMFLLFHRSLKAKMEAMTVDSRIKDKFIFVSTLIVLILVTIFMAISGFLNLPMWIFASFGALFLIVSVLVYDAIKKQKPVVLLSSSKRLPFTLAPFLLSMFGIVMALSKVGVNRMIADFLLGLEPTWSYGISSFLATNVMNNLPMSILYADLLSFVGNNLNALYATIIASNVGAIFSPLGALAGIMWMRILKDHDVSFSFARFVKYGSLISIPALLAALGGLFIL